MGKVWWLLGCAGCGGGWVACETVTPEGSECFDHGTAYQQSGAGADQCEWEGATAHDVSCADLGYGCPAPDAPAGLFLPDDAC